jgi:hypothetical protein
MKIFILIILFLLSTPSFAQEFKTGDVLLQPLYCRLCEMIEEEEQSIYSHMGLVIIVDGQVKVLESFAYGVKLVSLKEFSQKTQKGQKLKHLPMRNEFHVDYLSDSKQVQRLLDLYRNKYHGLLYDPLFLWDNVDEHGKELLYCSELVVKILNEILIWKYPIKRMHFSRQVQAWDNYYRGNTPRDQWGNSPADFERSTEFITLGEVD